MDHFAGLDVSVKETSVCIVDDTGKIVREVQVASEPEALLAVLRNSAYRRALNSHCDSGPASNPIRLKPALFGHPLSAAMLFAVYSIANLVSVPMRISTAALVRLGTGSGSQAAAPAPC